jgi:hypothetical protein
MKWLLLGLALVYLVLREVAWRADFMAALAGVHHGRPLLALVEVLFFGLRVVLLVAGPSFIAAYLVHRLLRRA